MAFSCWFNHPRLNQNVSVQATSLNQRGSQRVETFPRSESGTSFPRPWWEGENSYEYSLPFCLVCLQMVYHED